MQLALNKCLATNTIEISSLFLKLILFRIDFFLQKNGPKKKKPHQLWKCNGDLLRNI